MTLNDLDLQLLVDGRPSARYPLYTRRHVDEQFPGVVTPLSWTSIGGRRMDVAGREALVRLGAFDADEFVSEEMEVLGLFSGHCYLNASVQSALADRVREALDAGRSPSGRLAETIEWVLNRFSVPELEDARRAVAGLRADRPELSRLSSRQLFGRARTIIAGWTDALLRDHAFLTWATTIPMTVTLSACADLGQPTRTLQLVGALGGIDTAEPSGALWLLGRLVAGSPSLSAAFDRGTDDLLVGLSGGGEDAATFVHEFDGFLYEFGSVGPNDWDISAPTWETHPELALAAIDRMRLATEEKPPQARHARFTTDRRAAMSATFDQLAAVDPARRDSLETALRALRRLVRARERSKTTILRMQHEARMPLYEIGRRLVEEGYLDRVADFGMLTLEEFPEFLEDPESSTDTIRQRRIRHEALSELRPPLVVDGQVPSTGPWRELDDDADLVVTMPGESVGGIPACPGRATGTVRVVTNPADPTNLRPGDVLVVPVAGPSWIPLFLPAGAVVVEVGGPFGHAGVASREFGVPTVVACTGATRRLPEGARVTVDGGDGTVTIHDPAPSPGRP